MSTFESCRDLLLSDSPEFLMGVIITLIGIVSILVYFLRNRPQEMYILYLGIFTFLYGFRVLADNSLVWTMGILPDNLLRFIVAIITYYITVFPLLFATYFIGWGWKRSILWFIILQLAFGVTATLVDISLNRPYYSGNPLSNILSITGIVVILANLFPTRIRMNSELRIFGIGFGIFVLAALHENLVSIHLLPWNFSIEGPAFFVFICFLIYLAILSSSRTEQQYLMIRRDLETAQEIQNAILPQQVPSTAACSISANYFPMASIGGDFYDFHSPDKDHLGILVADVSGHGIPAALIASMVKIAFTSQFAQSGEPALLLGGMSRALTGQLHNEFITAAYVYFDFTSMTITCSEAGHPPLFLYRKATSTVEEIRVTGIPIGISPETVYLQASVPARSGDRLVIYTDGIEEVFDQQKVLFGKERLKTLIVETAGLAPDLCSAAMMEKVYAWSGRKPAQGLDDDVTLIVVDIS
jgi:phosphoserine phosphatase RsbU/P